MSSDFDISYIGPSSSPSTGPGSGPSSGPSPELELDPTSVNDISKDSTFLYPTLDDPQFSAKLAQHKEFADAKYNGEIRDVKTHANILCKEGFELAPHQWFVKNFLSTNSPYNGLLLYGGLGTGKCMGKDSLVAMADSTIRRIQDINVGDRLLGDANDARTVLSITSGQDIMYTVSQSHADPYVVNGEHILCLVALNFPLHVGNNRIWSVVRGKIKEHALDRYRPPTKSNSNENTNNNIIEISVNKYLTLPEQVKAQLRGFRTAAPAEAPKRIDSLMFNYSTEESIAIVDISSVLQITKQSIEKYLFAPAILRTKFVQKLYDYTKTKDNIDDDETIVYTGPLSIARNICTIIRSTGAECSIIAIDGISVNVRIDTIKNSVSSLKYIRESRRASKTSCSSCSACILGKYCSQHRPYSTTLSEISITVKHEDEYFGFTLDGNGRYVLGDLTVTHNTCSAIGVAEEMRAYLHLTAHSGQPRIIIVADPNVQTNFRRQLFDESKLRLANGRWDIQSCVGAALLRELMPFATQAELSREALIHQIQAIIRHNYMFKGYRSFCNEIEGLIQPNPELSNAQNAAYITKVLQDRYNDCLIIIDEVHNMRMIDSTPVDKSSGNGNGSDVAPISTQKLKSVKLLMMMIRQVENVKLLLLSATPMYNSHHEIIWIANLLNLNDRRPAISRHDVFINKPTRGESVFIPASPSKESGEDILRRKLTGYVAFVRSEDPYTFPYRVYPAQFAPEHSFMGEITRPTMQHTGIPVENVEYSVDIYLSKMGEYQEAGYLAALKIEKDAHDIGKYMKSLPRKALNIVFPIADVNMRTLTSRSTLDLILGTRGLERVMKFKEVSDNVPEKYDFSYAQDTGQSSRIFHMDNLGNYSGKMAAALSATAKSTGVVLIFSQMIDGGCIPLALALEEMGLTRFVPPVEGARNTSGNLFGAAHFAKYPSVHLDARTMKPRATLPRDAAFTQARYAIISGNKALSPNNGAVMDVVAHPNNAEGASVKVIIVSLAGSEGLDFKCVRQVHIIDSWFNMSRIEQIIGRGVRNLSHCALPFEDRNVEIYLHASLLNSTPEVETIDVFMYRFAEEKARQVGEVSRLMKQNAVDCVVNHAQLNFTEENMASIESNRNIYMRLSSGNTIPYRVGDKPGSVTCDYQFDCVFECSAPPLPKDAGPMSIYRPAFASVNADAIRRKVGDMFRDGVVYSRSQIISRVNAVRIYPIEHIYMALSQMIDDPAYRIVDPSGRAGKLDNNGEYYMFRPTEITDTHASLLERTAPIEYKPTFMRLDLSVNPQTDVENIVDNSVKRIATIMGLSYHQAVVRIISKKQSARKTWSWYMIAGSLSDYLEEIHGITRNQFIAYVIGHMFDTLPIDDKVVVLNALYCKDIDTENMFSMEQNWCVQLKAYTDSQILTTGTKQGILLFDSSNVPVLYVKDEQNGTGVWRIATFTEYTSNIGADGIDRSFASALEKRRHVDVAGSKYVGFMSCFNKKEFIFKVLNMTNLTNQHNKGSRADQMSRATTESVLASIADEFATEIKDSTAEMSSTDMYVIIEMLMRHHGDKGAIFVNDAEINAWARGMKSWYML